MPLQIGPEFKNICLPMNFQPRNIKEERPFKLEYVKTFSTSAFLNYSRVVHEQTGHSGRAWMLFTHSTMRIYLSLQ